MRSQIIHPLVISSDIYYQMQKRERDTGKEKQSITREIYDPSLEITRRLKFIRSIDDYV